MIVGSIHGRFQPFHNAHLVYLNSALAECDRIYIGITNIPHIQEMRTLAGPHRDEEHSNPLSYFERHRMITGLISHLEISDKVAGIVPFPIERPDAIHYYLGRDVEVFTTRQSKWNDEKAARLEKVGYSVTFLKLELDHVEVASGTKIREAIRGGNTNWKRFVPSSVASFVDDELGGYM